jgi:hypothetical protein
VRSGDRDIVHCVSWVSSLVRPGCEWTDSSGCSLGARIGVGGILGTGQWHLAGAGLGFWIVVHFRCKETTLL